MKKILLIFFALCYVVCLVGAMMTAIGGLRQSIDLFCAGVTVIKIVALPSLVGVICRIWNWIGES